MGHLHVHVFRVNAQLFKALWVKGLGAGQMAILEAYDYWTNNHNQKVVQKFASSRDGPEQSIETRQK